MGAFGFPYSWIFLPPIFLLVFLLPWIVMGESFSVKFILHSLWYTPLVYVFMNLFFQCDLLCLFFVWFFSQPDVNITWITGHIHHSIVDKIEPTSEYVEMVKTNTLSITLGFIYLWNVIRKMYLPCVQLISKNTFDEPWRGPPLFNLKSGRMANYDICSGKLFTRSLRCFGFKL